MLIYLFPSRGWQQARVALLVAALLVFAPPANGEKANVLLISIDTVRADHLGCFGYGRKTSPSLDGLAKEGVLFRSAFSQAPWTLPSHMSVFTGQYTSTHGVNDISKRLAEKKHTLAGILKLNGYETAALVNDGNLKKHWGCDRGFDLWREFSAIRPEGSCTNITSKAIEWVKAKSEGDDERPFMLFLHYFDAHDPYNPPPPYGKIFARGYSGSIQPDDTARLLHFFRPITRTFEARADLDYVRSLYDGEIRYLDDSIGKLLKAVKRFGFEKSTVVVVFSDHGEEFEEHLSTTHGATLYEEQLHVPLIIRTPFGLEPGTIVDEQVELVDVLATLLELLGLAPYSGSQGVSRLDLAKGRGKKYGWARAETLRVMEGLSLKSLRSLNIKYIYSLLDGQEELYDLRTDAGEKKNLVETKPKVTKVFRREMEGWVNSVEDYWRLRIPVGDGGVLAEGKMRAGTGKFGVVFPIGLGDGDKFSVSRGWDEIRFQISRGKNEKGIYFELMDSKASLKVDSAVKGLEMFGVSGSKKLEGNAEVPPDELTTLPYRSASQLVLRDGLGPILQHFRGKRRTTRPAKRADLDNATKEMLRTLGYIR